MTPQVLEWYQLVVDKAITEERNSGGYRQEGNIDLMRRYVRQDPKSAQIIIQFLHESNKDTAKLHGLWITVAYILEFGKMDPSSLMLKKFAPKFYKAAVKEIKKQKL